MAPQRRIRPALIPFVVSDRAFIAATTLLFAVSAAITIVWSASMSAMGGMPMPGGWTMSMAWMRMPGQSWFGAAATFLGMWSVMMVAMMLPSLVPSLRRYRRSLAGIAGARSEVLTGLAAAGYFFVWVLFGLVAFPAGAALAEITMRQPALARDVPMATGAIVIVMGAIQLSAWKARQLACCREGPADDSRVRADAGRAWSHGLRLGFQCVRCCGSLMLVLLVLGVMDLRAMALIAAAITLERFAPAGERVAQAIGAVLLATGLTLSARAAGFG